jgi:hypothetical protein
MVHTDTEGGGCGFLIASAVLGDLVIAGAGARLRQTIPGGGRTALAAVLRDPPRGCSTQVTSRKRDEWIELAGPAARRG